jgi:hypothetical protein
MSPVSLAGTGATGFAMIPTPLRESPSYRANRAARRGSPRSSRVFTYAGVPEDCGSRTLLATRSHRRCRLDSATIDNLHLAEAQPA